MDTYLCVSICAGARVCLYVERPEADVGCLPLPVFRWGLPLNPEVSDWLECLTSELQGICLSCSPAHSLALALYIGFEALESYL